MIILEPNFTVNAAPTKPIPRLSDQTNLLFTEDLQDTQRRDDIIDIRPNERTEQNVIYNGKGVSIRGREFDFLELLSFLDKTPKIINEETNIDTSIQYSLTLKLVTIQDLNNLEYASSFTLHCLKKSTNHDDKVNILSCLLSNYNPNEIIKNPDFAQYNIRSVGTNYLYTIGSRPFMVKPEKSDSINQLPQFAMFIAFITYFNNKDYKLANNIAKDILKSTHYLLDKHKNCESEYQSTFDKLMKINQFLTKDCAQKVKISFKPHFMKSFEFISNEASSLLIERKYKEVIEQFAQIISNEKEQYDNKYLAACRCNIGVAYNMLDQHDKAVGVLEEAYKYYTKDIDTIYELSCTYIALNKPESNRKFINGIKDKSIKTFFQLVRNPKLCSESQIKKINSSQIPLHFQKHLTHFNIFAQLNRPNKGSNLISKVKDDINKLAKTEKDYALAIACYGKFDDLITQIVKSITPEEAAKDSYLQKFKLLYDAISQEEIKNSSFDKAEMYEIAATAAICNNDLDTAKLAIEKGLQLDPTNENLLATNDDIAHLSSNSTTQTQDLQEFDKVYVEPAHKAEHQYHQLRKKRIIQEALANILSRPTEAQEWKIGDLTVKQSDTVPLGKYRHLDCYGYIPEKMQRKANGLLDKFIEALGKGIISRDQDQAGVKIISHKCFEIKIFENKRLYTNELYFNENGSLLAVFNHFGNHNDVADFVKKHRLHFVNGTVAR